MTPPLSTHHTRFLLLFAACAVGLLSLPAHADDLDDLSARVADANKNIEQIRNQYIGRIDFDNISEIDARLQEGMVLMELGDPARASVIFLDIVSRDEWKGKTAYTRAYFLLARSLYWNNERSFVGISVPTIYAADGKVTSELPNSPEHYFTQHYYLNAGHVFELNDNFDLKPSVLIKYQQQAPPEVDLNLNVLFKDRFWLGAGYRTGDAVVGMVEFQINRMFRAGYAYDMNTSKLRHYNGGSHEVMLGIDLGKEPIMIKNPRYF